MLTRFHHAHKILQEIMSTRLPNIESLGPWIELQFTRSPGPGGQNVNKVNTRVTLLFDFASCAKLSDRQRDRIRRRLRTRLSRDGRLRIVRHRERTQARNREAAQQQLMVLLVEMMKESKPRTPTRPTLGSKRRRLDDKRRRGQLKQQRRSDGDG